MTSSSTLKQKKNQILTKKSLIQISGFFDPTTVPDRAFLGTSAGFHGLKTFVVADGVKIFRWWRFDIAAAAPPPSSSYSSSSSFTLSSELSSPPSSLLSPLLLLLRLRSRSFFAPHRSRNSIGTSSSANHQEPRIRQKKKSNQIDDKSQIKI